MTEALVIAHHAGTTTPFVRSAKHSISWFGGPLESTVTGDQLAKPLHQIATLNVSHLLDHSTPVNAWQLPLIYGLFYDSALLRYGFKRFRSVEISPGVLGEPVPDWPYRHYPELLPFVPLEPAEPVKESWQAFCERAPNLPRQQPTEVVVLVPPPATIGFSMWGRSGDDEGVTLVFECNLQDQVVTTYNVCT